MNQHDLYTIGYCRFSPEEMLAIFNESQIKAVIDVRATPYSRAFPMYNREAIKKFFNGNGLYYLSFATEFGGRLTPEKDSVGSAERYDYLRNSQDFKKGCERLHEGLMKFNVCLMCAQKDPITCHRSILISHNYRLLYPETRIFHISPEGLETQKDLDARVLKKFLKKTDPLLNPSTESQLDEAYRLQFQNTCA